MKKIKIVSLLCLILISCNSNSPKLSGDWLSLQGKTLSISQEDDKYFVKVGGANFMGKFEEDKIKIESPLGDVKYSKEKDKLYFAGDEFSRKEFVESEERRIQSDKVSFNSVWQKIPKSGGQFLSDFLVIELLESGRFKINERNSSFEESEFRNVTYDNGIITGTFYYVIDNEHTINFEIKKSDTNTIVYKDVNSEEYYKRYVEIDKYTGKWKGYYLSYGNAGEIEEKDPTFTFTITKETSKYRIKVESRTSSKPDNYLAKLIGGKIVVDGNDKDFYKFQKPTIESSANGNLLFKDGSGDIRLKRTNK